MHETHNSITAFQREARKPDLSGDCGFLFYIPGALSRLRTSEDSLQTEYVAVMIQREACE